MNLYGVSWPTLLRRRSRRPSLLLKKLRKSQCVILVQALSGRRTAIILFKDQVLFYSTRFARLSRPTPEQPSFRLSDGALHSRLRYLPHVIWPLTVSVLSTTRLLTLYWYLDAAHLVTSSYH